MPATAPLPMTSPMPTPPASTPGSDLRTPSADASGRGFDSHLASARQARDPAAAGDPSPRVDESGAAKDARAGDAAGSESAGATADPADATHGASDTVSLPPGASTVCVTPPAPVTDGDAVAADDDGHEGVDPATSVAGAMLALLGQAMPARASVVAGGAAKVMAAGVLKASLGRPVADASAVDAAMADAAAPAARGASADAVMADAGVGGARGARGVPAAVPFADVFAAGLPATHGDKPGADKALDALSPLLAATPQPTGNTGVAPPHALTIGSPAGSPAFAQELGQQIAWLGNQDIKQARIRLHPEELGQLDVKVSLQHGGQVDVSFAAQHPGAVHALQQTLPQLDALLAQHGLSLGQAQVGQHSPGGGDGNRGGRAGFGGGAEGDAMGDEPLAAPMSVSALGLLDTFA